MLEVLEPLAPKFGDTPSIPIGCNRLQPIGKFGVATVLDGNLAPGVSAISSPLSHHTGAIYNLSDHNNLL